MSYMKYTSIIKQTKRTQPKLVKPSQVKSRQVNWKITFKNRNKPQLYDIDRDGVPNYRDCKPFDRRYHTIEEEERAKKHFGTTKDPHKSAWILPSGEMLDFSEENKERLYPDASRRETTSDQQIAHWEIGKVVPATGRAANRYFEREGAIRFRKTAERGMYAQMVKKPTREQARTLSQAIATEPRPTFLVIERVPPTIKPGVPQEEQEEYYEEADYPHPTIIHRFIKKAWR